jgi:hypothetical protein
MKFLKVIFLVLLNLASSAQKKEANSHADLPVLNFSTALLQTGNADSIDVWMRQTALIELKHLDSIESNYIIKNPRLQFELVNLKLFYNFTIHNWEQVKNADTIFRNLSFTSARIKKIGAVDISTFAKTTLESPANFIETYKRLFDTAIAPLDKKDKKEFLNNVIGITKFGHQLFNSRLEAIKESAFVADSSLLYLYLSYIYEILNRKTGSVFIDDYTDLLKAGFTRADTLRGTLLPERIWWDVLRYDITVKPDFTTKTIIGTNNMQYKVVNEKHPNVMQIDLQEPLQIDSIFFNNTKKLSFVKDGNAWHVNVPAQKNKSINSLLIYYHGKAHEGVRPPWEGGWTWKRDSLNNPWMSVSCQGIGASIWFPCKDHQSDEPDNGASLTMIVPDTLVAIANGRMISKTDNHDGTTTYKWGVVNPINNYEIIPCIGKYLNFNEVYNGAKGKLDVNFWVLNYNLERAKNYLPAEVNKMLEAHEYWFGPYPFYEDGYKLIESPIGGMEHQSAIAYSGYHYGTGTGWASKWDYLIVHESGHEWFGNNITTKDIADMWVHEGFGCYSETLYTEYWFGKEAGNEYNYNNRKSITNTFPIIGYYGVNDELFLRSNDMYNKGANLLHTIRHSMNDDEKFKAILRGLNKTFYHQTVTSAQVENYITNQSGYDYTKVFDQYLRNTQIPQFEFYFSDDKQRVLYRYTNCINGFNLPLSLNDSTTKLKIYPEQKWKNNKVTSAEAALFNASAINEMYYVEVKEAQKSEVRNNSKK